MHEEQGGAIGPQEGSDWEALTHFNCMSVTRHSRRSPSQCCPWYPRTMSCQHQMARLGTKLMNSASQANVTLASLLAQQQVVACGGTGVAVPSASSEALLQPRVMHRGAEKHLPSSERAAALSISLCHKALPAKQTQPDSRAADSVIRVTCESLFRSTKTSQVY